MENGVGEMKEVGDDGSEADVRVRWHSRKTEGIEDAGKRDGSAKAWMDVKMLLAYGS